MMKQAFAALIVAGLAISGCTLKHQIVPSEEPLAFNINVNITQEVRVRLDKEVEDLIANNPDLF